MSWLLADIINKLCLLCGKVQQCTQQGSFKDVLKGILENNVVFTLVKYLNDLFLVTDFDCVQIKKKAYQGELKEIIDPTWFTNRQIQQIFKKTSQRT